MEYLWLSTMWNTLQKRNQLWGLGESQRRPGSGFSLQTSVVFCFFSPCPSPRLLTRLGPLMSKSMCGCGCSIISSLMKRLGCAVCCSDLFSSHTSEQLQRLAAGCPPQRKVTPPRSHLCPLLNGFLCDYSRNPRVMCCEGSIWPHAEPSFIYNLNSSTVLFTSNHTLSMCVKWLHGFVNKRPPNPLGRI